MHIRRISCGCDPFRIDHGFIRRHIEMQVLLVDPSEGTQIGPERRACPFTGIAVDLTAAIAIIIPRPFVHAVADRGMGWMAPPIALPLIGIELRAANRNVFRDEARDTSACPRGRTPKSAARPSRAR